MNDILFHNILSSHTSKGLLFIPMPNDWVQCTACGHRCKIAPNKSGICCMRSNHEGTLLVPWGYASSIAVDPIEKKPFYHAYPGSTAFSFGMLGCDYHCAFCQNWDISQTLRDDQARSTITEISTRDIVDLALQHQAPIITSTYNEPLITTEWAVEIFKLAKQAGLITSYVSNGNASPEALAYLRPWIDLYKIDLKAFRQKTYTQIGGELQTVLDTISSLHQHGIWVEVVTLVIPGMNDSKEELHDIASFLASLSPDMPWHVTAYHEEYHMKAAEPWTPPAALLCAAEIGYNAGLHYVYTGNLPGQTKNYENTYCPSCGGLLIERHGYRIIRNRIEHGACDRCQTPIAGRWQPVLSA